MSWSWWMGGLRCQIPSGIYWGCGFKSHKGHGWSTYPCKAIISCMFNFGLQFKVRPDFRIHQQKVIPHRVRCWCWCWKWIYAIYPHVLWIKGLFWIVKGGLGACPKIILEMYTNILVMYSKCDPNLGHLIPAPMWS